MTKTDRSDTSTDRTVGDETGLDAVDPKTHPARDATHFRRIVEAREGIGEAEQRLRDAVAEARKAGDSWTIIGAALGTTRQNAQIRFGKQVSGSSS